MKTIPTRIVPLLGLTALLGSATVANAFTFFTENFSYVEGQLTGNGGWTSEGTSLNVATGTFDNGLLPSAGTGNRGTIDSSSGSQSSSHAFSVPAGLGDDGSEFWYSFLFQDDGSPSSSSDFSIFSEDTSGPVTLRITNSEVQIRFGGTTLDTIASATNTGPNLFVGRVIYSDTDLADSHTVWMNPTATAGGVPTGGLTGGGGPGVKNVEDPEDGFITLQGGTAWLGSYDEIRLGTTLGDVMAIPEPSMTAAFLGFGVGAIVLLRRRRS
ncbi:MAG: hypothetical protein ACSHYA_13540 [Opitutaceae bacterium]